jgi:hypothetical protein
MDTTESVNDQPSPQTPDAKTRDARPFSASLDKSLFWIVCMMLLFTVAYLSVNLWFQYRHYNAGITAALGADGIDHAVVITYTRAWDFAVVKVSSILLAFCLIMVGALYVLRVATVSYSFTMANQAQKSSLETSSPGLVMITLGVALMAVVLFSTSKVQYQSASDSPMLSEPPLIPANDAPPSTSQTPQPARQTDNK